MPHPLWTRGLFLMYPRTRYTCSTRQVRQKKVHIAWSSMIMHQNEGSLSCELPSKTGKSRVFRYVLSFSQGKQDWKEFSRSRKNRIGSNKHNRLWARFDLTSPLELQNRKAFWQSKKTSYKDFSFAPYDVMSRKYCEPSLLRHCTLSLTIPL